MAKILYLSCHSILEYEEVKLLTELGHEVFSPGAYVEPLNPGDSSLRPGIPGLVYNPDILAKFHAIHDRFPGQDNKDHLTKEVVDYFDIIVIMHLPRWIQNNWQVFSGKKVIWRTIGQSIHNTEAQLKPYRERGLQIIRYSPMERNIPGYLGEDAMIRFYKDPEEYKDWNGNTKEVITFAQSMKQRGEACGFNYFEEISRPFPRKLFGSESKEVGDWGMGKVPFDQLKQEMKNNRVYFYTGTHPASYTLNFMEAWMTGIPIVALGPQLGNPPWLQYKLYEVSELLEQGETGFSSDNKYELQSYIKELFNNDSLANKISSQARTKALEIFGKETIKEQWKGYLG